MTDRELVERFENLTLEAFPHRDHVRLAWCYLREDELIDALQRFASGLKRFAAHHGATGKYHETITWGYLLLIHDRMRDGETFEEFAARNADLLDWERPILLRYYTPELLWSDRARHTFVWPDITAPPELPKPPAHRS